MVASSDACYEASTPLPTWMLAVPFLTMLVAGGVLSALGY